MRVWAGALRFAVRLAFDAALLAMVLTGIADEWGSVLWEWNVDGGGTRERREVTVVPQVKHTLQRLRGGAERS